MSVTGPSSSCDLSPGSAAGSDPQVAAFRHRARHLLETQRLRIRQVETQLSEQVATLFEKMRQDKLRAVEEQRELHAQVEKLEAERRESHGAEGDARRLLAEARDALAAAHQQQCQLRSQLRETSELLDVRSRELEQARSEPGAGIAEPPAALIAEVTRLEEECEQLRHTLAETQAGCADSSKDSLQQQLEAAVQEIRQLKTENESLEREQATVARQARASSPTNAPDSSAAGNAGFDWESQKQMLLAQLETDFDTEDPGQREAKLTVEGAIRITDQIVAEKEREIEELQRLLSEQSGSIGDMAVGAAAVAGVLDQDELIRDERENLRRLQDEWREKLRQAEVDISVERAKMARERLEIEEKVQRVQAELAALEPNNGTPETLPKGARGNWLSRLGLKDDN